MKKICCVLFVVIMLVCASGYAAPFAKKNSGPSVMIGEVHCYGQYDLGKFVDVLQDKVSDNMHQLGKMNVVAGSPNNDLMERVHKNAIVKGHFYNRGTSGVELIKYANNVLGKNYRPTDDECKQKEKNAGTPYALSPDIALELKTYAERESVDYVVFFNLNYVEVWLKNSIFNTNNTFDYRGKSVSTNVEYYLVNAKTGMVYDGVDRQKTTAQQIDLFVVSYGKGMDISMITADIMDKHAKSMIKKIFSDGIKKI